MARNHKDNSLFSIDLEAIERVLEDANAPMLSQAEQIISKALEYPNEINENASQDNLEKWDSVMHMNLVIALESEFNIELTGDQILEMLNYKLIVYTISEATAL